MDKLKILAVAVCLIHAAFSQCSSNTPESERRECYWWTGGDQGICEARGCVWCESQTGGVPWCFMDEESCPSSIPEASRSDCHPEPDVTRESCTSRGCVYCPTDTAGIPWCFTDPDVSHGGKVCPAIPEQERVDCMPTGTMDEDVCINKGCYYCTSATSGVPHCFTSPNIGYKMVAPPVPTAKGYQVELQRVNFPSWYGEAITTVMVDVEFQENERLRVKLYDPSTARYEVPVSIPSPSSQAPNPLYNIEFTDDPAFSFKVTRSSNGQVLYDSSLGGLLFEDQFLQIAGKLASTNVYGFGETEHHTLRHDMNWVHWGMWARDEPISDNANIYGVHPFMTCLDINNEGYGILILNSNAQEVVLTPAPGLVYRTSGGILDMYFFLGPTLENVIEQYTGAIGRPVMPPYWMLGFHLSRYGYNTIQNMSGVVNRMRQYDIPHDVQHGDIDYFDRVLSFTYDPVNFTGMPAYVQKLKSEGTRFITIVDPFIATEVGYEPFDRGQAAGVWVTESDGVTPAESTCWPEGTVYYPDFSKQEARDWWLNEFVLFHDVIEFDGLWVDMNEPASFSEGSINGCNDNEINFPLYKPSAVWGSLPEKTLCPDFLSEFGNHYNTHSLYGWSCGLPARDGAALATGKRSYAVIRSTYPGIGQYGGHWLGDNSAEWAHLGYSIIGSLEFNTFGIPFVGADICGYFGDSTSSLCKRWMQLGSFYTFCRNHNGLGWTEHDPGRWPDVAAVSRDVLHIRYTLLPYLYTLFHESHVYGRTVMRPLHHEFSSDANTHGISFQLMWGSGLLITPVIEQDATSVLGYFPDARWYSYYDGVEELTRGDFTTLSAPVEVIPLHFRGGHVFPTQQPSNSTMFSRSLPMGLVVALDDTDTASGSLFWDEGDTPDTYENGEYFFATYDVAAGSMTGTIITDGYAAMEPLVFEYVKVYGQGTAVTAVTVNGSNWTSFTYDTITKVLEIFGLGVAVRSDFTVQWS